MQSTEYIAIFIVTIGLLSILSLRNSTRVKSGISFTLSGRNLDSRGVAAVIIGTLVGGASTIGTVEIAYQWGFSACYFTFGASLGCLVLGLFFSKALRESEVSTVSEFLGKSFGRKFQIYSSIWSTLGMFVHIVAQFLAAMAIIEAVTSWNHFFSGAVVGLLLLLFVVSGGMVGASWIGKIKTFFLYAIMGVAAGTALWQGNGWNGITGHLPAAEPWLSFFGYGIKRGLLEIGSLIIGVLSTQTYLQAVFSASDMRTARNGAFLSAILIPPVGIFGIIVGLHLHGCPGWAGNSSAQALPWFLNSILPGPLAAISLAGLLLIILGTASGLALGVTTNLCTDILGGIRNRETWFQSLSGMRITGSVVVCLAGGLVWFGLGTAILHWSYLSMGMRGISILPGLLASIFFPRMCENSGVRFVLYFLPVIYIFLIF